MSYQEVKMDSWRLMLPKIGRVNAQAVDHYPPGSLMLNKVEENGSLTFLYKAEGWNMNNGLPLPEPMQYDLVQF